MALFFSAELEKLTCKVSLANISQTGSTHTQKNLDEWLETRRILRWIVPLKSVAIYEPFSRMEMCEDFDTVCMFPVMLCETVCPLHTSTTHFSKVNNQHHVLLTLNNNSVHQHTIWTLIITWNSHLYSVFCFIGLIDCCIFWKKQTNSRIMIRRPQKAQS